MRKPRFGAIATLVVVAGLAMPSAAWAECPGGVSDPGGVVGCNPSPGPSPTQTSTPKPSPSPKPTSSPTTKPKPTTSPSASKSPTVDPSPTKPAKNSPDPSASPTTAPFPTEFPTDFPTPEYPDNVDGGYSGPGEERPPDFTTPDVTYPPASDLAAAPSTEASSGPFMRILTLLVAAGGITFMLVRARVRRWMVGI